jgi:2-keto-4-pentenoate hydratase/2-oxohepta-3-ene-1,7-dioic acid hydratase in catechol pathway
MKLYVTSDGICRLAPAGTPGDELELLDVPYADLGAALAAGCTIDDLRESPVRARTSLADAQRQLCAPVIRPPKVVCIGINYSDHIDELRSVMPDFEPPGRPVFFLVPGSAVMGPNDPIVLPSRWPDQVDYESELAVVIGRAAKDVGEGEVWDHIAGVTMANDVSARDIQMEAFGGHEMTLTHAKGLDGFKPMGPCLVTLDELGVTGAGLDVRIGCTVNGERRQDARTADLVHDVPRSVSYVSQYMRLDPGDVLLTGSPAGVGFFQGKFLRAGDVVETSGEGIGTMRNEVVAS